jgi:hypothetical protein
MNLRAKEIESLTRTQQLNGDNGLGAEGRVDVIDRKEIRRQTQRERKRKRKLERGREREIERG